METLDAIKARRSVRKFSNRKILNSVLYAIFDSAICAPSAGNVQNWRFIVVEDENKKKMIAEAALEQDFIVDAPIVVVVCSVNDGLKREYDERGEKLYSHQGVAAAIENMLISAADLGIGSCWVGAFTEAKIRAHLAVPDNVSIEAIIPLGYPAEKPKMPGRINASDVFYFEKWGESARGKDIFPIHKAVEEGRKKAKEVISDIIERAKKRHKAVG